MITIIAMFLCARVLLNEPPSGAPSGAVPTAVAGDPSATPPADSTAKKPDFRRAEDGTPIIPEDTTEESLIAIIRKLDESPKEDGAAPPASQGAGPGRADLLAYLDEFLKRFPKSPFRTDAFIIKLRTLASYARVQPAFLTELLELNETIRKEKPDERLAAENDYYAIQAFVMGARHEKMAEDRKLQGTAERYRAFIEDHPKSQHLPVIRASLVRSLLAQKKTDDAEKELAALTAQFPDHQAARRAKGEVYRVRAVGQPFAFQYTAPDGKTVRSTDFTGKVLILHFWASWNRESTEALDKLRSLRESYGERGLELVGINVDKHMRLMEMAMHTHNVNWPQYFDAKALDNALVIDAGVVQLPTYFVIDRNGVLRSTEPGDKLEELVKELLDKSAEKTNP